MEIYGVVSKEIPDFNEIGIGEN